MSVVGSPRRVLLAALVFGALVDLFFYQKPLGVSVFLLVSLLLCALFALGSGEGVRPVRANLWLVAPLLFFAAMVCVRASESLLFLNTAAVGILLTLVVHFWAAERFDRLSLAGYFAVPFRVTGSALWRAAPLLGSAVDMGAVRARGGRNLFPLMRGLLLAAPVVLVFAVLLASADLVFARWIERLTRLEIPLDAEEWFGRAARIFCAAWALAGGFAYAVWRGRAAAAPGAAPTGGLLPARMRLGLVEAGTVLVCVNALFVLFVGIQFAYLFGGGHRNVVAGEFTYADYARRGFFELVMVSLMSLGLIGSLRAITRREPGAQTRVFNILGTVLVELVLVLLASAWERMRLYEAAYGATELRLFTQVFMVWLAVVCVWFLTTLWFRLERFAPGVFACAVGFLVTLNLIDPDVYIARKNLARYARTGEMDVNYVVFRLSEDAVPTLVRALPLLRGNDAQVLRDGLDSRKKEMEANPEWRSWPAFHLARRRAHAALTGGNNQ